MRLSGRCRARRCGAGLLLFAGAALAAFATGASAGSATGAAASALASETGIATDRSSSNTSPPKTVADPLRSPAWPDLQKKLGIATLRFDPRVEVLAPEVAEDSLSVPVTVAVNGLADVRRVLVVADLNPIVTALEFEPLRAMPRLSFRLKLQQASPVRALVQTADGDWVAGGRWVDAAGGGCTAPSVGRTSNTWADTLGQVDLRRWPRSTGARLKFRVMHPMDTGLAPGIPAFHLQELRLRDPAGALWARLHVFEPVSENPMFSLDFAEPTPPLTLEGEDNNGNRVRFGEGGQ